MDNIVITIARQYGSGGRTIGEMLADKLGIHFYDKELMKLTVLSDSPGHYAKEDLPGIFPELKEQIEDEKNNIDRDRLGFDEESFKGDFYHGQKRKKKNQ